MECFNKDIYIEENKEKMTPFVHQGRGDQITYRTKLLSIKYKFYGFSDDLIETTN